MSQFATPGQLRDFLELAGTTGRKSDDNLGMLLDAASDFLERKTGRTIEYAPNQTRTYSTNGRAYIAIGDWWSIDSVTNQGVTLDADSTYWGIKSLQNPNVTIALQLRSFNTGRFDYRSNPEWFDRNLDSWLYPGNRGGATTLPNDLVITGDVGWMDTPPVWKHATIALAAYYYNHADALYSSARQTPEGNVFDLSRLPSEVQSLITDWALGEMAVIV